MPRILVVESNPKVESDRLEALSGQALGPLYAATLQGLRDDVETVVISPYDGDETPEGGPPVLLQGERVRGMEENRAFSAPLRRGEPRSHHG